MSQLSFLRKLIYAIPSSTLLSAMSFFAVPASFFFSVHVLAAHISCEEAFFNPVPAEAWAHMLAQAKSRKHIESRDLQPIVRPADLSIFYSDISGPGQLLLSNKGVEVFLVEGAKMTELALTELGRAREEVFRSVGEGSGLSSDTDAFDRHYDHFIALDTETHQILGAYRMGRVDQIVKEKGVQGIFFNEFFDNRALIREKGGQMLELTRSFADPSAGSKAIRALDSIWKGIALFLSENPRYRYLTGQVSISNTYSEPSKLLILKFLERFENKKLKAQVVSRVPVNIDSQFEHEIENLAHGLKDFKELNKTVVSIEGIGIPSLLISYGKLGAQYLGFDFDKNFNSIDGLIIIDVLDPQVAGEVSKHFGDRWGKYLQEASQF